MALNVETFKTRTLTAAVFVVVMLSGLLINQWTFLILFSIIHYGCWVEYQKLITLIDPDFNNISTFFGEEFLLIAGEIVCILIIASLWINDTMAYIVGSLIGKTPFSSISPKKTWEGTLGGALLAIAVVTLTYYLINKEYIS